MNTRLTALTLFALTAATVGLYPIAKGAINTRPSPPAVTPPMVPISNANPRIEVVFVLDTTGSMGGLIQGAKDKIWSIASKMAQADPTPEIRMGLVAYRDRGDAYVTRVVDLSDDLDSMYATLMEFQAGGGGDGPESVNQALYDAVHGISWSADSETYKVVFLVGDAPPHMDYADEVQFPQTLSLAAQRDIVINTIQCGHHNQTLGVWQQIAQAGMGRYFQVEQDGGALAITTPYDQRLAELSASLDDTRVYFGSADKRAAAQLKVDAARKLNAEAPVETRAARGAFNSSAGGERNFLGDDELVDAVSSGRVDLEELDADLLPESVQAMAPSEQKDYIASQADRRNELKAEINQISRQREAYMLEKAEELGGAESSFDYKIQSAVREQAEKKGLHYESASDKE